MEFRLVKKSAGWWERLLKEKSRQHWLRVDFQNWKDEDDVGDESESFEEVQYFIKMLMSNVMLEHLEHQRRCQVGNYRMKRPG